MKAECKVFEGEEQEAVKRDPKNDLERFHACCHTIKACVSSMKDVKAASGKETSQEKQGVHADAMTQFVEMKKLNRLAHFRCRKAREATNESKHKIDQCHLTLQNLLYEVMHLQKEVTKCMEFKSKDEEIELVSVEDFYASAPESISNDSITKTDSHKQTLARLEWELEQRKQLASKLKELESNKEKITLDIKSKEEYLQTLQPKLSAILSATRPIQDYLSINYDAVREEHSKARHLAPPLYILYMQLSAYKDACAHSLVVAIEGDVEAAIALTGRSLQLDEDSDSDQDEQEAGDAQESRRRKSTDARRKDKQSRILQKHPLTVTLEIGLEDGTKLHLTFNSLMALKIVSVNVKATLGPTASGTSISGGDLMSPDLLLDELYPGDHGNHSPNMANQYELNKCGLDNLSGHFDEIGRPYQWCQWLAGLQFLPATDPSNSKQHQSARDNLNHQTAEATTATATGSSSPSATTDGGCSSVTGTSIIKEVKARHSVSVSHMEETVNRLKQRLHSRVALLSHITHIERGTIPLNQDMSRLFPAKVISRLTAWRRSTFEDVAALKQASRAIAAQVIRPSDFIFTATIDRASAKCTAYVVLAADCPSVPPYFVLDLWWQGQRTALTDVHIMELEEEVNLHHEELNLNPSSGTTNGGGKDLLLCGQLQRLLMCLDVYLETSGPPNLDPKPFISDKVLPRCARGRSRSKPYKYVAELGIFTQRLV